ncbi:hypothetical protein Brsp07_05394 [Brucella sp. NBRC 14130]|uniref:SU10 major capsid protein n=1 Tax=Brucella sp. NBRC 14130 TaxID=3075483 RepID=UPI0030AA3AD4
MAGTFKTTDTNTINEQWHKVMSTVAREETPVQTLCPSDSVGATTAFWFTDSLAAANANNAQVEGAAAPEANLVAPEKLSNHTQIFSKTAEVARTLRSSITLGTNDEFSRQFDKISKEVKRDVEAALIGGQGSVEHTGTVAGRLAGIEATIKENAFHAASGDTPGYTSPVYGSVVNADEADLREFTEDMLNDAQQKAWAAGGRPDTVLVNGRLKRRISSFKGNSTMYQDATKKKIFNVVDTYVGDFGTYSVIPHYLMSTTTVLGIDPSKFVVSYLDKWTKYDHGKTGDSDKKTLVAELTLKALDERSHFKIADVK